MLTIFLATSACDRSPAPAHAIGDTLSIEITGERGTLHVEPAIVSIDVPGIIGMAKKEVDTLWGLSTCPQQSGCKYGGGKEVFFVANRAANLTLPPTDDLRTYGLNLGPPDFTNDKVEIKRWNTIMKGRPAEVSQFADYVYVKTQEP